MNLFKSFFNSNSEDKPTEFPWKPVNSITQLEEIKEESMLRTVVLFKHSTRCSISRMALKQFETTFNKNLNISTYYLDLLNHREISNAIATEFQVVHQSPQIIVLKNKEVVHQASHEGIDATILSKYA